MTPPDDLTKIPDSEVKIIDVNSDHDSVGGSLAESLLRLPPRNLDAEKSLLGAILVNNQAYERVSGFLQPQHFSDPIHTRIYEACSRLIERNQIADPITLRGYFEQDGALAEIGGVRYLMQMAAQMVTVINAADYGREIYDSALRRALIGIGEDIVNKAYHYDLENGATQQIEAAEARLFSLAETGNVENSMQSLAQATAEAINMADQAYKHEGQLTGVSTGLIDLDALLGGLQASDLIILAARPSMGKTALATNIALDAAQKNAGVAFFSLEMSAAQLANRMLSACIGVPSNDLRRGRLNKEQFSQLIATAQQFERLNFFIDDTPNLSISRLRTRARRLKRTHNIDLIILDYLQLMQSAPGARAENRVLEIAEITRGLKGLAKELNLPILAASQLSRQVEQREDKRPQLSDLRESGAIEQDADVVMFIYRAEYYEARKEPIDIGDDKYAEKKLAYDTRMAKIQNIAELIIGKQRHGPIGTVITRFTGETTSFQNLEKHHNYHDDP